MHLTGVEEFELPTKEQFLYLGLNGLIGTVSVLIQVVKHVYQVVCELVWIYACFLTSPLQGTLALSLINPGSILADYVSLSSFKIDVHISPSCYTVPLLVSVSSLAPP